MGKGSKRRPGNDEAYRSNPIWDKKETSLHKWAKSDVGAPKPGNIPDKISEGLDTIPGGFGKAQENKT